MHAIPCQDNTNSVLKEINTYCKYRNEDFYNSSFFKTAIQNGLFHNILDWFE